MNELCALVPIDTTEASRAALKLLPLLQEIGFTKIRLVSVVNSKNNSTNNDELSNYLEGISADVAARGLLCETKVRVGDPFDVILSEANEFDIDLLVIATHKRTGLARFRPGSVSDKLIKNASCPRLVIGPNVEIGVDSYDLTNVVVPLDGSELAELSVPIARYLAKVSKASVTLVRAVSSTNTAAGPDGSAFVDVLTPALREAENYLELTKKNFDGLTVVTDVVIGRPQEAIFEHIVNSNNDLVVMASRGRTGLTRAVLGSTTESVLKGPDPVLVYEPGEDRSRLFEAARSSV